MTPRTQKVTGVRPGSGSGEAVRVRTVGPRAGLRNRDRMAQRNRVLSNQDLLHQQSQNLLSLAISSVSARTRSLLRNPARLSASCRYFASSTAAIFRDCNSDSTACVCFCNAGILCRSWEGSASPLGRRSPGVRCSSPREPVPGAISFRLRKGPLFVRPRGGDRFRSGLAADLPASRMISFHTN